MSAGVRREGTASLLRESETCWKVARATRASLLIDGEEYFGTLRAALLQAKKQILIAGWDFDSRMHLPPRDSARRSGELDSAPLRLSEFLAYLKRKRPALQIEVARWDYPWIFRDDREADTRAQLERVGVTFHDDRGHPVAGSVHHKIVVIDGVLAFCGGIDLTHERWDTSHHYPNDLRRRTSDGKPYMPVHDTALCVSGPAAEALHAYLRESWPSTVKPALPDGMEEIWPEGLRVDFADVRTGVCRTRPASAESATVREIEAFYLAALHATERHLYIENQYFTSTRIARAIAERCLSAPSLEGLLVGMEKPKTPAELHTMGYGLTQFHKVLEDHGVTHRVPLVAAMSAEKAINLHSKLAIFDERWLTCGSANLNRRSMGYDIECNLVLEATSAAHCERMRQLRAHLIAEHLGMQDWEVARALRVHGLARLPALRSHGRHLVHLQTQALRPMFGPVLAPLFDREDQWIPPAWSLINSSARRSLPMRPNA